MRTLALSAALLGGIAWVANLYVDAGALSLTGTVLLGVAVVVVGSRLARQAWLAVVAAAGSLLLAWSLLGLLRDQLPDGVLEAALGGVASLSVAVAVVRGPRHPPPTGNHRD